VALTAADVPERYDVILNGVGYAFYDPDGGKKYGFTDIQSIFQYTPTFVQRSNTQGDFGDEFQDFWLTYSQNDWSLGDNQKFYRSREETSRSRYYGGSGIDVSVPGQVNLGLRTIATAPAAAVVAAWPSGSQATGARQIAFATSTTLYTVDNTGAVTSEGAHGLGAAPTCGCRDNDNDYLSTTATGTVGVRKYTGSAFSTFSATGADSLCFVNNALYGFSGLTGGAGNAKLLRYDTAGTASTLFEWKSSNGGSTVLNGYLIPYGGKVLILLDNTGNNGISGAELWMYDGVGTFKIAELGKGVKAYRTAQFLSPACVVNGIVYVGVSLNAGGSSGVGGSAAVWYYANGATGILWKDIAPDSAGGVSCSSFNGGLLFIVQTSGSVWFYDPLTSRIAKYTNLPAAPAGTILVSASSYAAVFNGSGNFYTLFGYSGASTQYAASGTLTSSQIDFDSSLDKLFRGIKVDFETASGASVDIAYQVDGVGGTYTTLQTGATSGTEYGLTGISGRTISVKLTLNGSGANSGPTIKRVSVRAAPKQTSKRKTTYVLNLTGVNGVNHPKLRDGTFDVNDGLAQATNLASVVTTATPVTIIDELGTYTGVIDNDGFEIRRIAPKEYVATVPIREV